MFSRTQPYIVKISQLLFLVRFPSLSGVERDKPPCRFVMRGCFTLCYFKDRQVWKHTIADSAMLTSPSTSEYRITYQEPDCGSELLISRVTSLNNDCKFICSARYA